MILIVREHRHEDVKSEDDGTKPPSTGDDATKKEEQKPALNPSNIISSAFTNIRTIHALSMQDWVSTIFKACSL